MQFPSPLNPAWSVQISGTLSGRMQAGSISNRPMLRIYSATTQTRTRPIIVSVIISSSQHWTMTISIVEEVQVLIRQWKVTSIKGTFRENALKTSIVLITITERRLSLS